MRNGVNSVNEISAVTFGKLRASCQTMRLPLAMPGSCAATTQERIVFGVRVVGGGGEMGSLGIGGIAQVLSPTPK